MKKKYSIFTPCEEAQHFCDKSQYKEATIWEQVKLNLHLVVCRACQKYTSGNQKLTKLMKSDDLKTMKSDEKSELEAMFQKELSNN